MHALGALCWRDVPHSPGFHSCGWLTYWVEDGLHAHWIVEWTASATAQHRNRMRWRSLQQLITIQLITIQLTIYHASSSQTHPQQTTMQLFTTLAIIATAAATASAAHINGVMYSQPARGLMQHSICLDNEGCLSLRDEAPMEDVEAHRQLALTHAAKNASATIAPKTSTKGVVCWGPCCAKCHYYRHLRAARPWTPILWDENEGDESGTEDQDDETEVEDEAGSEGEGSIAKEIKCMRRAWGIECDKH